MRTLALSKAVTVALCALACTLAAAQSIVRVERAQFRDLTSPFDSKRIAHFFGAAEGPGGESWDLEITGPIVVNISRSANLDFGGKVVITSRDMSGRVVARWQETLASFSAPNEILRRIEGAGGISRLQIVVIDDAAGGPGRRPPYTLVVEAWPISSAGMVAEARAISVAAQGPESSPQCALADSLDVRPEFVTAGESIPRGDPRKELLLLRTLTAGAQVGVLLPEEWARAGPVRIKLSAKQPGDQPLMAVCDVSWDRSGAGKMVVGRAPVADESIWQIEIMAPAIEQVVARAATVRKTKALAAAPTISYSDRWRHGLARLCFDRRLNRVVQLASMNGFGGRSLLSVTVLRANSGIAEDQDTSLDDVLLQAVYLWVRACALCRLDNLALVKVNGRTYAHPGLYGPFGPSNGRSAGQQPVARQPPHQSWPSDQELESWLVSGLSAGRIGAPIQSQPYRRITGPLRAEFAAICQATPSLQRTPTLYAVQRAVCESQHGPRDIAEISVRFVSGQTYCGNDTQIIACRADRELTEFNVRDYRFRLEDSAIRHIGNGALEVDFLHSVLHEMGHWIGLEHIDGGESIMASTLEHSRCIDYSTVETLSRQAVTDASQRHPSAFRYR